VSHCVKVNPALVLVNLVDPGGNEVSVEDPKQTGRDVENQVGR
jgi:hypothetical protein